MRVAVLLLAIVCVSCGDTTGGGSRIASVRHREDTARKVCIGAGGVPIYSDRGVTVSYDSGFGYVTVDHVERCEMPCGTRR
jgi:hypothetical protein